MKIHFLGAAKTVTGSNYLIEANGKKFLIDCGLYQGTPSIEKHNKDPFEFDPSNIDFMILTHSHIDHSGRIPLLSKKGFSGKIYCTRPASALSDIMLKDSAIIQEEEAAINNKRRKKAGLEPEEPLYSVEDAENAIQYLYPVDYDTNINVDSGISFLFKDAGHLLGSSYIELTIIEDGQSKTLTFSGDLGSGNSKLLDDYKQPSKADYLVMESTYGIRNHQGVEERSSKLVEEIQSTLKEGGTVIIPSFAVGRTQEIVYEIRSFFESQNRISEFHKIPIYVDSPLSIEATKVYSKYSEYMTKSVAERFTDKKNPLHDINIKYVTAPADSQALVFSKEPKVIISASGMCSAGRVKMHLMVNLPKPNSKVIFVGYQGIGTLGSEIQQKPELVDIFGESIVVACKVITIQGFSGHADSNGLVGWAKKIKKSSGFKKIFLCHGELESLDGLKDRIIQEIDSNCEVIIPSPGDEVNI